MQDIVKLSGHLSILIQFLTGVIGLHGFSYKLSPQHSILKEILLLETIVQFIELLAYVFMYRYFDPPNISVFRYYDWFLTTPTMLMSTILYLEYIASTTPINMRTFVKNNIKDVSLIMSLNMLMLLFGYLGEKGVLERKNACFLGFIPFVMCFSHMYNKYGSKTPQGRKIVKYMFIIWSMYGLVYLLPNAPKNVSYNCLDLVAKNAWGLFIYSSIKNKKI
jgi:bacteriorhodopsin